MPLPSGRESHQPWPGDRRTTTARPDPQHHQVDAHEPTPPNGPEHCHYPAPSKHDHTTTPPQSRPPPRHAPPNAEPYGTACARYVHASTPQRSPAPRCSDPGCSDPGCPRRNPQPRPSRTCPQSQRHPQATTARPHHSRRDHEPNRCPPRADLDPCATNARVASGNCSAKIALASPTTPVVSALGCAGGQASSCRCRCHRDRGPCW